MGDVRKTNDQFIADAIAVHGYKYDYNRVDYKTNHDKVEIICKEHGSFFVKPNAHLSCKTGCPKCGKERAWRSHLLTTDQFIEKAKKISPQYDYSKVVYIRSKEKVIVSCKKHGDFLVRPNSILNGSGCPKCGALIKPESIMVFKDEFIERANKVHDNKYEYIKYTRMHEKATIKCPIHGVFKQDANNHISGSGCFKCGLLIRGNGRASTQEDIINKFIKKHGNVYDYSKVNYKRSFIKVEIICKKHGSFYQAPNMHLSGCGCPICKASKAEKLIYNYLSDNNIKFISQKTFIDCKNIKPLPFDFYIPNLNICIEYDGELHYKCFRRSSSGIAKLVKTQKNDSIKNEYCLKNNIKLIRIPYWEIDNIYSILEKHLKEIS